MESFAARTMNVSFPEKVEDLYKYFCSHKFKCMWMTVPVKQCRCVLTTSLLFLSQFCPNYRPPCMCHLYYSYSPPPQVQVYTTNFKLNNRSESWFLSLIFVLSYQNLWRYCISKILFFSFFCLPCGWDSCIFIYLSQWSMLKSSLLNPGADHEIF